MVNEDETRTRPGPGANRCILSCWAFGIVGLLLWVYGWQQLANFVGVAGIVIQLGAVLWHFLRKGSVEDWPRW